MGGGGGGGGGGGEVWSLLTIHIRILCGEQAKGTE